MTLHDKHAEESVAEIGEDLWKLYHEARAAEQGWKRIAENYLERIKAAAGDAFAITVAGVKVFTNRPTKSYAVVRLQEDYPDLTQHFTKTVVKTEFDLEAFALVHPDIAEEYRVRSFREVEQK